MEVALERMDEPPVTEMLRCQVIVWRRIAGVGWAEQLTAVEAEINRG
jgi:hypothetical protein